ncbi:MAG TPA: ABC transporter ATP-binding protein [Myxococcaceae bacterium]|nr:ABC transporter ATP-binding protein [Myxococcaceae bacterium]
MRPPEMIQVEQLSKYYGARAAIRNLTFRIDPGEVVGFLGLNGAGKTTTLRILGCVLLPTSGTVRLAGQDLLTAPRQLKARIGFLPETPPLYEDMTVGEYLAFVAGIRSVDPGRIPARVTETEERTGLADLDGERISTLSHGFQQRVGVAQALVHDPDVLLLDEPANGLDPVQNVEMRTLIRSLRGDHTVLVSSHILPEIAQTCDRLLVVRDGELVAQGSETELEERLGVGTGVELEISGPVDAVAIALRGVTGVRAVAVQPIAGGRAILRVEAPDALRPALARTALAAGAQLFRLDVSADRLESLFLKLAGRGPTA